MRIGNRPSMKRMGLMALSLLFTLFFFTACASAPITADTSMPAASEAIDRAEQADSRQYAPGLLDQAKQKLERAAAAFEEKEYVEAEQLAQQAKITAELAVAKTQSVKAENINREMARGDQALTEEMRRQGDSR